MPNGVYSRSQIQDLRRTLETVLQGRGPPSPNLRERVARIAVRIADERDVYDPERLVALVRDELRQADEPVARQG